MKKTLLFIAAVVAFTVSANAQVIKEKNERPEKVFHSPSGHGLGVVLSSTNGKGLAYRYWKKDAGFHVAFFPAATNENKYYNTGITGYLTLRNYEFGRLFLHAGAEYVYMAEENYYSYYENGDYHSGSYTLKTNGLNIGAGPGLHVIQKFVSMDLFAGYGAYIKDRSASLENVPDPKDETTVTLSAGIALWIEL